MQRRRVWMWLVGSSWLALAGGCQSMGARGPSATGPSPAFGLSYAPAQSEPLLQDAAGLKSASRSQKSESVSDPENDNSATAAKNRSRLLPGNDNEPRQGKALPVSARTAAAADDDGLDL